MAYEKTNWVDNETPINATNLNKMEDGIVEASKTGGILTGTTVLWDRNKPIPQGYQAVKSNNSGWEKLEFESLTEHVNTAYSFIYVNKLLKLVYVQICTNKELPTGTTELAVVPSPYRPNLQPEDTCWFNMWSCVGDLANTTTYGRGSIYGGTGLLKVLSAYGSIPQLVGTVIYPYVETID